MDVWRRLRRENAPPACLSPPLCEMCSARHPGASWGGVTAVTAGINSQLVSVTSRHWMSNKDLLFAAYVQWRAVMGCTAVAAARSASFEKKRAAKTVPARSMAPNRSAAIRWRT